MSSVRRSVFAAVSLFGMSAFFMLAAAPSQADTGTITAKITTGGVGIGGGSGNGTLKFRRKTYPFSVSGNVVGVVGVSTKSFAGRAYNLTKPEDIVGSYTVAGAGVAVVKGVRLLRLANSNGVILELRGVSTGLEVQAGVTAVNVTMP